MRTNQMDKKKIYLTVFSIQMSYSTCSVNVLEEEADKGLVCQDLFWTLF